MPAKTRAPRPARKRPAPPSARMPARSSIDDIIDLYKRDVDRTLLREQLKKTPDERLRELVAMERFVEELRRSLRESAR